MPRERSLLERLRDPEPEGGRTIQENTSRLADSVLGNLRRLLNSRHGIAEAQPDYGIPDLCDLVHVFPDGLASLRRALKEAIETYEPRLGRVSVKHVEARDDDPLAIRFEITAELRTAQERASVWFETRIDSSGEVEVKG